jgi:radical SAM superfamily enzyme YgiQ (UPF0313 family)
MFYENLVSNQPENANGVDVVLVRTWDQDILSPKAFVQDALGVGYLAAVLREHKYSVAVVDAHTLEYSDEELVNCLGNLHPKVVGISLHSCIDYKHCVYISDALSRLDPKIYCVWGGEHATFNAERILAQHPFVDAVVLGEGEITFLELLKAKLDGNLTSIPGALLRDENKIPVSGGNRPAIEDLDDLPFPHKDIVNTACKAGKKVTLSILTGRGCTNNCRFCTAHTFLRLGGGKVWRRRSPASVADEVEQLASSYLKHPLVHPVLHFQDVIFLGTSNESKEWICQYLNELEKRSLTVPFYCMTRVDAILANEAILPRLVKAGLISTEVGIESGVDRILKLYNKHNNAQDNERAIALLRKNGVAFDASGFIMFDPFMTLEELRVNAKFLLNHGAATWNFFTSRLQLYPGTEIREEMIQKNLFNDKGDIGRTSRYSFQDSKVQLVAKHARIYDQSIIDLDIALRKAKAIVAQKVRGQQNDFEALSKVITQVEEAYYWHFLTMINQAKIGDLANCFPALLKTFLARVRNLQAQIEPLVKISGM